MFTLNDQERTPRQYDPKFYRESDRATTFSPSFLGMTKDRTVELYLQAPKREKPPQWTALPWCYESDAHPVAWSGACITVDQPGKPSGRQR